MHEQSFYALGGVDASDCAKLMVAIGSSSGE